MGGGHAVRAAGPVGPQRHAEGDQGRETRWSRLTEEGRRCDARLPWFWGVAVRVAGSRLTGLSLDAER